MSDSRHSSGITLRAARESDAGQIARLSGQLGYPTTAEDIVRRLRSLAPASQHAVLVAETLSKEVIGWIHVSVNHLLEVDQRGEVDGLVVAEGQRSLGAGRLLLEQAEKWARERGCGTMSVRSNVIRTRAHEFYEKMGYENYKMQKAFRKTL